MPAIDRFFMMPILSLWTDVFAAPGTRTTGRNAARNFLLVGPRCQGEAPPPLDQREEALPQPVAGHVARIKLRWLL